MRACLSIVSLMIGSSGATCSLHFFMSAVSAEGPSGS